MRKILIIFVTIFLAYAFSNEGQEEWGISLSSEGMLGGMYKIPQLGGEKVLSKNIDFYLLYKL